MVILASFEATLLETKYIACKIVNKRSLNIKNRAFREPNKTHPSGMSETAVGRKRDGRERSCETRREGGRQTGETTAKDHGDGCRGHGGPRLPSPSRSRAREQDRKKAGRKGTIMQSKPGERSTDGRNDSQRPRWLLSRPLRPSPAPTAAESSSQRQRLRSQLSLTLFCNISIIVFLLYHNFCNTFINTVTITRYASGSGTTISGTAASSSGATTSATLRRPGTYVRFSTTRRPGRDCAAAAPQRATRARTADP